MDASDADADRKPTVGTSAGASWVGVPSSPQAVRPLVSNTITTAAPTPPLAPRICPPSRPSGEAWQIPPAADNGRLPVDREASLTLNMPARPIGAIWAD